MPSSLNVQFEWLAHGRGPVEGDNYARPGPPRMRLVEMDFSHEELKNLQHYAQAMGLSLEMATRQLVVASMTRSAAAAPSPISPGFQEAIEKLERRVEKLERQAVQAEDGLPPPARPM